MSPMIAPFMLHSPFSFLCFLLSCTRSIHESHLRSGLRRTGLFLHDCSASRETSLSFGERPLASCPAKAPRLGCMVPRGNAYPQVSPSFRNHAVRGCPCRICFWHHSATSASDSRYTRVSPVQDRQRSVAFPRLLPCGATRLDPRLFPNVGRLFPLPGALHHWSAIARAET